MRPEEIIEKRFVKKVEELDPNLMCHKFEIHGKKGAPDRIVFMPGGVTFFFEFKKPGGGSVSRHQEKFIVDLQKLGYMAQVVDSWEEPLQIVMNYLEDLRRRCNNGSS